jgi:hypothetical protein
MCLLLTSLAWAQIPATADEDVLVKLRAITNDNDSVAAAAHLHAHGVTISNLPEVKKYLADEDKRLERYILDRMTYICAHRDTFDNDAEALASYWDETVAGKAKIRAESVAGLNKLMSESDLAGFQTFVAHSERVHGYQPDHGFIIRSGQRTPKEYNDRTCSMMKMGTQDETHNSRHVVDHGLR